MSTVTSYSYGGDGAAPQKILTGAHTVKGHETGTEFVLKAAGGAAITLPAAAPGLEYRFTIGQTFSSTAWTITTPAAATIINGSVEVAGAVVVAAAEHTITFVATAEALGDTVRLSSDGSTWFLSGSAALSGGITVTDA